MFTDIIAGGRQAGFVDPVVDHTQDLLLSWREFLHSAVTLNVSTVLIYRYVVQMQREIEDLFLGA